MDECLYIRQAGNRIKTPGRLDVRVVECLVRSGDRSRMDGLMARSIRRRSMDAMMGRSIDI